MTAADAESGVAWTRVLWDVDDACTTGDDYTTPLAIPADGAEHILYACAENNARLQITTSSAMGIDLSAPTVAADKSGWYVAATSVAITSGDLESGIAWTKYLWDTDDACATGATYTAPLPIPTGAGSLHTLYVCTQNGAGTQTELSAVMGVDTSAPTLSADKAGWFTTATDVAIASADLESGIAWTKYLWDTDDACATGTTYDAPIAIPPGAGSIHTLYTCTQNGAGTQTELSAVMGVDTSAPTLSADQAGWFTTATDVAITSGDLESGIAWTKYLWDTDDACATGATYTAPLPIPTGAGGLHTLYMCTQNGAGTQVSASAVMGLDTTVPTGTGVTYSAGCLAAPPIAVASSGTDAESGIASSRVEYQSAALATDGTCSGWTAWAIATLAGGDFAGVDATCYRFRAAFQNNAGLSTTSAQGGDVKVSSCGDAKLCADIETCDDGVNNGSYNGCMPGCQAVGPHCGDGTTQGPTLEQCDDANSVNTDDCRNDCKLPTCGDGLVSTGATVPEVCDGALVPGKSCTDLGFTSGTLQCNGTCGGYLLSGCLGGCGNNLREYPEQCDGTDVGTMTCQLLGYTGGTLGCRSDANCAAFDTSNCLGTPPICTGPDTYRQTSPALNVNLADGEPCNFRSDCTSGHCNSNYYCGLDSVAPTIHSGDLPLGWACDVDGACESGYCWMGGDSYICAEACGTAVMPSGPGLACQTDPYSPTAAACIPGPGPGAVGAACVSGAFDCADRLCLLEEFCTKLCDPTVTTPGDPDGCPTGATCSYFGIDASAVEIYICVADSRVRQDEGGVCALPIDCTAGLDCIASQCRKPCPTGTECPNDFYCASDNPAGPVCLPESARKDVGETCAYTSECKTSLVCYDEGTGLKCHNTCPTGTCTGGLNCVQAETGPALDTVVTVYRDDAPTTVWGEDDDSGVGLFSFLSKALGAANPAFHVKVMRYAGSPVGPYDLTVALNATVPSTIVNEVEPNNVNTPTDQAQALTLPARVRASFVDQGTTADVDWFKLTTTGTTADLLKITTSVATSSVCIAGTPLAADGVACSTPGTCQHDCFPFIRVGTQSFCAKPCSNSTECSGGTCQQFADVSPSQGYCFPAGSVTLGTRTFGQTCVGPQDCASHMCLRHKFGAAYQCGDVCTTGDTACGAAGMCSATDPIYGMACVPTLAPKGAPGASCVWTADCLTGNVCVAEVCQPQSSVSRYNPPAGGLGASCNLDTDCTSPLTCTNYYCNDGAVTGCSGGAGNGSIQAGELCDGTDVGSATCATIGAGTGTLTCNSTCNGYDLSSCTGFPNGHACNGPTDCLVGSYCFQDGSLWYCAYSCGTNPSDAGCSGSMFNGLAVSCQPDLMYAGYYVCLPSAGAGSPADPCRSSYLDCASNWCWNSTFCVTACSSSAPNCGSNASCMTYDAYTTDAALMVDTSVAVLDSSGATLASNDNIAVGQNLTASYFGAIDYYNNSATVMTAYVAVSATSAPTTPLAKAGNYQLQLFSYTEAPPFGAPILESELGTPPVANNTRPTAQDLTGVGLPTRLAANLATATDVDFFKVTIQPYEQLVAKTTYPIGQICWPNTEINRPVNAECVFDFECATGTCFTRCATECTDLSVSCSASTSCDAFLADYRYYCFETLQFNDSCVGSMMGPLLDVPSCPNDLCLTRDGGVTSWCSDTCWGIGMGCGDYTTSYNGECTIFDDRGGAFGLQAVCEPNLGGTVAIGSACALDSDCAWTSPNYTCCDQTTAKCVADTGAYGDVPCNYMRCVTSGECNWLAYSHDCCDQTSLNCVDSTANCIVD